LTGRNCGGAKRRDWTQSWLNAAQNSGGNSGRIGYDFGAVGSDCGKTYGEKADPGALSQLSSQV